MGQAVKAKRLRSSSKLPDFWMAEPRGEYKGFFLELKRSRDEVFRKDGSIKKDQHVIGQMEILERLQKKGYYAYFACGIDEAIDSVDSYMAYENGYNRG